jgi:hypothetical protein
LITKRITLKWFNCQVGRPDGHRSGKEVAAVFSSLGYKVEIVKDIEGKDRVVKEVKA